MTDRKVLSAVEQRPRVINEAIRQLQQAQIADYQPLDSDLTAIAALTTATFGRSLLTETSAANAFTTLKQAATESATGVAELATTSEASTGTDTSRIVTPAGLTSFAQLTGHAPDVIVEDQKAQNTAGGTATSGSWQTRTLNTLVRNHGTLATLGSNQITLPAGTYVFRWTAPAQYCGGNQTRLRNVSDSTNVGLGTSEVNPSGASFQYNTHSTGVGVVTIASSKVFELQHQVITTRATDGYGLAANIGTEVYSRVEITKVA
jgi:hypothetical protein